MKKLLTPFLAATAMIAMPAMGQDLQRVVPTSQAQVQLSYSPVVKQTSPAVVNIFTSRTVRTRTRSSFFDQMFGMQRAPRERVESSLGSGVIVRSNGIIITLSLIHI